MSSTATATRTQSGRGRLPAVRRDRRPALAALALLLVLGGALGSALVAYRSGDRVEVLVAREDIAFGQQITGDEFGVVRVAADTANVIEAEFRRNFDDSFANGRIPAGTLVNEQMFRTDSVLPDGTELVGLVVDMTRRTTERPEPGDVVSLYYVSQGGEQSGSYVPGDAVVEAARVMQVDTAGSGAGLSITVLVDDQIAGQLAEFAASSSLAVSVLPGTTEPDVDTE